MFAARIALDVYPDWHRRIYLAPMFTTADYVASVAGNRLLCVLYGNIMIPLLYVSMLVYCGLWNIWLLLFTFCEVFGLLTSLI